VTPKLRFAKRTATAAVLVIVIGTSGYMIIEDMSTFDALYMTTITVTTIGFKEVVPLSTGGQLFTILMAFAGVGVILLVAGELGHTVLETDLRRIVGLRRDLSMIKRMSNHIVVCGYGRMGRAVVEVLKERQVPFVVVESSHDTCQRLEEERIPFVEGDATKETTLRAARLPEAKTLLACLTDDALNVFAILLVRQLNPNVVTIARAVEEGSEERLRLAGAHKVINPYRIGGTRLAYTALKPTVMDFIDASVSSNSVELELAEFVVASNSELAGKTLAGADVRRRFGVIVVALQRGTASTFNPEPDSQIEAGDVLVALGPLRALERIEQAVTN